MIFIVIALLVSASVYLLLSPRLLKKVYGLILLSSVINIIILVCGRTDKSVPAFVGLGPADALANPLPQALILTAIVIGFGLLAYLCALLKALYQKQDEASAQ